MSDALLERLAKATEGILAHIQKSPVFGLPPAGAANNGGKPATGAAATNKPAAGAAAGNKPAAGAAATNKPAAAAAGNKPGTGPAAGTKAPGGKYTVEQVRDIIRKVASDAALGKQSAADILDQDGGGVTRVTDLKPENFDKVYEACQVLLSSGEAAAPAAAEDDLM